MFLAGLANKVLSAGTLTDPGKLERLTEAIKKSVVVNKGWDILSFAQQMKDFTGADRVPHRPDRESGSRLETDRHQDQPQ